jgi:hypothetical protein
MSVLFSLELFSVPSVNNLGCTLCEYDLYNYWLCSQHPLFNKFRLSENKCMNKFLLACNVLASRKPRNDAHTSEILH